MNVQYIANGRFDYPTIWLDGVRAQAEVAYPDSLALSVGTALDCYSQLAEALVKAGQLGTIATKLRELGG